ncbi:MAG TPA: hypothetical protein VGR57_12875 [Ktedonobacterales bacterium]|nr:hypothetical protein [Ktedonobacterales bacterium]
MILFVSQAPALGMLVPVLIGVAVLEATACGRPGAGDSGLAGRCGQP